MLNWRMIFRLVIGATLLELGLPQLLPRTAAVLRILGNRHFDFIDFKSLLLKIRLELMQIVFNHVFDKSVLGQDLYGDLMALGNDLHSHVAEKIRLEINSGLVLTVSQVNCSPPHDLIQGLIAAHFLAHGRILHRSRRFGALLCILA